MKFCNTYIKNGLLCLAVVLTTLSSCDKDDNPNNLPEVNPADYAGTVDGFNSTDELYPNNLVAYWNFDTNNNETKSNTAPTNAANVTTVDAGIKGKALNLNAGYLYYATPFNAFKTAALKSFTISTWVQIANNGSKKTMLFQLARPGMFNGNINFVLETNVLPATDVENLVVHPVFNTIGGGTQDNLNANRALKIGLNRWTHIALTYNGTTGIFNIIANGNNIGSYSSRGTGNNLFNSFEPNEVIIGGNYNVVTGKSVSTDVSFAAMTGRMDELRIYNIALPEAIVKSIYNLGLAGK
ncbi:MAG: LamG domain-containing protein [Sphingobacteriaceae bacterium]|nr:MAG: LamG domain-containing protein [Sphingobacteriaceae bacterium]